MMVKKAGKQKTQEKKVSREADQSDLEEGFSSTAPIMNARNLKHTPKEIPSSVKKRKFTFDNLVQSDIQPSAVNSKPKDRPKPKTQANSSKNSSKNPTASSDRSLKHASLALGYERIELPTFKKHSTFKKNTDAKKIDNDSISAENEDSVKMKPVTSKEAKHKPVTTANQKGKNWKDLIVPARSAAAPLHKISYVESSDSLDGEIRAARGSKKIKSSQYDRNEGREYGENENMAAKLEKLGSLSFDIPVQRSLFKKDDGLPDISAFKVKETMAISSDRQNCPIGLFCHAILPKILSPRLTRALEKYNDLKARCEVGEVSSEAVVGARDNFCYLHQAEETIIPKGIKNGYDKELDFQKIAPRLDQFKARLLGIADKEIQSSFLDDVLDIFSEMGHVKARGTEVQMISAERTQVGYYGITGYNWIFKYLLDTFRPTLKPEQVRPLTLVEFIQLVLVPEAALILIAEDFNLDLKLVKDKKKAGKILAKSAEFGNIVHADAQDDLLFGLGENHHVI